MFRGFARCAPATVLLSLAFGFTGFAEMGPRIGPEKKVIKAGQDMPDAVYVRGHIGEMERLPFDGIVIDPAAEIDGKKERLWLRWWAPDVMPDTWLQPTVENLKATRFDKFTDNFLWLSSQSQHARAPGWWDDPAFDTITANMALAARAARDSGIKGLFLDVEQYGGMAWSPYMMRFDYPNAHAQEKAMLSRGLIERVHTWAEFEEGARKRGTEMMKAMCAVYPGITLIVIPGLHQMARARVGKGQHSCPDEPLEGLASSDYGLLAAFGDGLLEGAAPSATVVDGFEDSYPYTLNNRFAQARKRIQEAAEVSALPGLYREKTKAGFGIMLDFEHGMRGWNTLAESFGSNHFTPVDFGNALYFGLLHSDRYVWIWNELGGAVFWNTTSDPAVTPNVPEAYLDAMAKARDPRDLDTGRDDGGLEQLPVPCSAKDLPDYGDEATYAPLNGRYEIVASLPATWKFLADEEALGFNLGFTDPQTDVSNWGSIEVGEYLQQRGKRFRGIAWYRCSFDVPKTVEGNHVCLLFGGVSARHVWVNGQWCDYAVESSVLIVDFTAHAKFRHDNVVVVPILTDGRSPCGIYKSVKLATLRASGTH